jgi:S-adenosyl methyltransferase
MGQPESQFPPPDPAPPSAARIYNYLIGGDNHYPADRAAARRILADFPEFAQLARANREFVTRAVHYIPTQGVIQFIDLGAGLPISPAVHETAWRPSPAPGSPTWTTIPWSTPAPVTSPAVPRRKSPRGSAGWKWSPPGLAEVQPWRADQGHAPPLRAARMLGAVGRRPVRGAPARGRQATNAYRSPATRSAGRMSGNYGSRDSKVPGVTSGSSEISEY